MKLFYYKSEEFEPIIFLIIKISNKKQTNEIESYANILFQVLIDHGNANEQNILIFSLIKDYDKSTENFILPSVKSNQTLLDRCSNEIEFVNRLIINTLINTDTEFYIELLSKKILIHNVKLNLMSFAKFYSY